MNQYQRAKESNMALKLLDQLPEEIAEPLDELRLEGRIEEARERALEVLHARSNLKHAQAFTGYHTTNPQYQPGEEIDPQLSRGLYQGKIFFAKTLDAAYMDDQPAHCYEIEVDGSHPDPEDLKGGDWFYTLSPARVRKEIPLSKVWEAKKDSE